MLDNTTVVANSTNFVYCNLKNVMSNYKVMHGQISIIVCVFGSIANILNICVLTSKKMRSSTNMVLTGLAIADLLVMIDYIIYASVNLDKNYSPSKFSYAVFIISHGLVSLTFHFVSCSLTIMLAIWRYVCITFPQISKVWCNPDMTLKFITSIYIFCTLLCALPNYFALSINTFYNNGTGTVPYNISLFNETDNITILYYVQHGNNATRTIIFVIYSVVMKLIPCVLLTVLSERLITALFKAKERRKLLLKKPTNTENGKRDDNEKQADRTTRMLLAVLLLFLLTEFPQAILGLLALILGDTFEKECYFPLGKPLFNIITIFLYTYFFKFAALRFYSIQTSIFF